jgi:hypothetical protein
MMEEEEEEKKERRENRRIERKGEKGKIELVNEDFLDIKCEM